MFCSDLKFLPIVELTIHGQKEKTRNKVGWGKILGCAPEMDSLAAGFQCYLAIFLY